MENEKYLENTKEKNEPEVMAESEPGTSWSAWGSWAASAVSAAAETVTKQVLIMATAPKGKIFLHYFYRTYNIAVSY